ncbi:siderophore-interacting protein [Kitasatospora sp. MBT63]|uniref:siderophore-interacting protein n=1 Tax=Kitasatospora sp. MBT63 TaxID=1444768 RepID=UPI00053AAFCF|nr:siderophore-interacting protein [Kitasatospora sp. MBT63]
MTGRQGRQTPAFEAEVIRTEWIAPHMIRVVIGGQGVAAFKSGRYADPFIKLLFPREGIEYPHPFDPGRIQDELPPEQWPVPRIYTVRSWDAALCELAVDFVVHGDEGVAGPWAAAVRPGETVWFAGPGGSYSPDPTADWHLLAGDASALPAMASALERMPAGALVHAFVEVAGPEDEQDVATPDGVGVTWLHRGDRRVGAALVAAVSALDFPAGDVCAFVHGEAGFVRELRRHLLLERGVPRERVSISGYWRLGHNDETWRVVKRDWIAGMEADEEEETASESDR